MAIIANAMEMVKDYNPDLINPNFTTNDQSCTWGNNIIPTWKSLLPNSFKNNVDGSIGNQCVVVVLIQN